MIKINCESSDTLKLTDMIAFQGNLKKRTKQDIDELTESLKTEGLMMPFAVWKHEGKVNLLDGHGRKQALVQMAVDEPELLNMEWPVIYVNAATEDDARKALLQITSSYGKVTKQGYKQFCVSIPEYKAPVIQKFIPKPVKQTAPKPVSDKTVLKIRVLNENVQQVLNIFKQFNFIEVL